MRVVALTEQSSMCEGLTFFVVQGKSASVIWTSVHRRHVRTEGRAWTAPTLSPAIVLTDTRVSSHPFYAFCGFRLPPPLWQFLSLCVCFSVSLSLYMYVAPFMTMV